MTIQQATITQTPVDYSVPKLNQADFDKLINDQGYDVEIESAVKCPCSNIKFGSAITGCINCFGLGWVFVNKRTAVIVLQSMNRNTKYQQWSEANTGTVSITAKYSDRLSIMDRVTLTKGEDIHTQLLSFEELSNKKLSAYTSYKIKAILQCFLFISESKPLKQLEESIDFTIDSNTIVLSNKFKAAQNDYQISIRYSHTPQYYIMDIPRNIMHNQKLICEGDLTEQDFPVHCIGRISHEVLNPNSI